MVGGGGGSRKSALSHQVVVRQSSSGKESVTEKVNIDGVTPRWLQRNGRRDRSKPFSERVLRVHLPFSTEYFPLISVFMSWI